MPPRHLTWSGKRTLAQQKRLFNAVISKLILLSSNAYHNHGPLTAADNKKIYTILQQLTNMQGKY